MSVRSSLTAGLCAVAAGIIAIPAAVPTPAPERHATVAAAPPVALAASVRTVTAEPPNPRRVLAAVDTMARLDPELAQAASTFRAAVSPAMPLAAPAPAPQNAASDWITSGYQFIQSWVQYGVALSTYVLQFIPYGYLISSQINIVYYNLIQPIADSVVYGLINPVVNDPLNPAVYVNGFLNVGQATVTALINTGIAEFNYFFGWLIPPIPPIPLAASVPDPTVTSLSADLEPTPDPTSAKLLAVTETTEVAEPTETAKAAEPTETAKAAEPAVTTTEEPTTPSETETPTEETKTPEPSKTPEPTEVDATTTSVGGVQAQGIVRDSTTTTTTTGQTTTTTTTAGSQNPVKTTPAETPSAPVASTPKADVPNTDDSAGRADQDKKDAAA